MAEATAFNVTAGLEIERKYMTTWVNVGDSETPVWECVGAGVEDSAIETNADVSTTTDILGVTKTKVNKLERAQTLDPMTATGGSLLQVKLYNDIRYEKLSAMSAYEVMIVHGYVGTDASFEAELYGACTLLVTSIGGSSYVDMPIEITLGGEKTLGTSSKFKSTDTPVFTPEV